MFELFYVFLFGFIMGMVSYVFFIEGPEPQNVEDMMKVYEKNCKEDMLKIFQERLKQD